MVCSGVDYGMFVCRLQYVRVQTGMFVCRLVCSFVDCSMFVCRLQYVRVQTVVCSFVDCSMFVCRLVCSCVDYGMFVCRLQYVRVQTSMFVCRLQYVRVQTMVYSCVDCSMFVCRLWYVRVQTICSFVDYAMFVCRPQYVRLQTAVCSCVDCSMFVCRLWYVRHFRWCKRGPRTFCNLRSSLWRFLTDASGQPICPTVKGRAACLTLEGCPETQVRKCHYTLRKMQKMCGSQRVCIDRYAVNVTGMNRLKMSHLLTQVDSGKLLRDNTEKVTLWFIYICIYTNNQTYVETRQCEQHSCFLFERSLVQISAWRPAVLPEASSGVP